MEERVVLYYVGVRLDSKGKRDYYYTNKDLSKQWVFSKKLYDVPVGVGIEVTPTETGVKGPYKPMWSEAKHPNAGEWHANDVAQRVIIQAKQVQAKVPEDIERFEKALTRVTLGMSRTQRQAFLMKYILNLD